MRTSLNVVPVVLGRPKHTALEVKEETAAFIAFDDFYNCPTFPRDRFFAKGLTSYICQEERLARSREYILLETEKHWA